jgi:hypothetical protein
MQGVRKEAVGPARDLVEWAAQRVAADPDALHELMSNPQMQDAGPDVLGVCRHLRCVAAQAAASARLAAESLPGLTTKRLAVFAVPARWP